MEIVPPCQKARATTPLHDIHLNAKTCTGHPGCHLSIHLFPHTLTNHHQIDKPNVQLQQSIDYSPTSTKSYLSFSETLSFLYFPNFWYLDAFSTVPHPILPQLFPSLAISNHKDTMLPCCTILCSCFYPSWREIFKYGVIERFSYSRQT